MYGTVMRYRMKPDSEDKALALTAEFRDHVPDGFVASYTYRLDAGDDSYITAVLFESREAYRASSDTPEQGEWYGRFSELMQGEPEWNDGEVFEAFTREG